MIENLLKAALYFPIQPDKIRKSKIFTRKELKKLFFFATWQAHFIFNFKFYNQIDGVAMGYLLAPVLANTFMGFHESKWLDEYNLNKTKLHLRYVDDILAAFDNEKDSLNFLKFFK